MKVQIRFDDTFADQPLRFEGTLTPEQCKVMVEGKDTTSIQDWVCLLLRVSLPNVPRESQHEDRFREELRILPHEMKEKAIRFVRVSLFSEFEEWELILPASENGPAKGAAFYFSKVSSSDFPDMEITVLVISDDRDHFPTISSENIRPSKEAREATEKENEYW